MSITIKNPKSADELAGHIQKNGVDILNAGAVTGAKKSIFKFNDMTVPVPGTNLQVKVKPQESHTFSAGANSLAGIALNNISKELGASTPDTPPTPVDNTIYVMIDTSTQSISCETPYSDISKMVGNIKAIVQVTVSDTLIVYEFNTIDGVSDLSKALMSTEYGDGIPVMPNDIIFYITGTDEMLLSLILTPDDVWHLNEDSIINNGSIFKVYYDNELKIEKLDWKGNDDTQKYIYFDGSALQYAVNTLKSMGYTEQVEYENLNEDAEINYYLNMLAVPYNGYMVAGNLNGYFYYDKFNTGTVYAYTNIIFGLKESKDNVTPLILHLIGTEDGVTLDPQDPDFMYSHDADTYDTTFTVSGDGNFTVTANPSIDASADGTISKLMVGNLNDYDVYNPRNAVAEWYDEDITALDPADISKSVTIPANYAQTSDQTPQAGKTYYVYNEWTGEYSVWTGETFTQGTTYYERVNSGARFAYQYSLYNKTNETWYSTIIWYNDSESKWVMSIVEQHT